MMKMFLVRWPGETGGAIGFALNFWFFWFKPKEHNRCNIPSFVTSNLYDEKLSLFIPCINNHYLLPVWQ